MFSYPSLADAPLDGKRVLLRAGFDVPMRDGVVTDSSRIALLVPTMRHLLERNAALIILAHQGRPHGEPDRRFSQRPLLPVLEELLERPVRFADSCTGERARTTAAALRPGEVLFLENLRFDPGETANDPAFAQALASLGDVYVNDAFPNCHRDHASMTTLARLLPAYPGLQLERELRHLSEVLDAPRRPLTLMIGGAKMETKVPVIRSFLTRGDDILTGGAIANTFLVARGFHPGRSRYESDFVDLARTLLEESGTDGKATIHTLDDAVVAANAEDNTPVLDVPLDGMTDAMAVFDIGKRTAARYASVIGRSGTIIWNGPVGMHEDAQFAAGSIAVAEAIADATAHGAVSVVGGGDSIAFHHRYHLDLSTYTFVSTGGGAMLAFLSGTTLPALHALMRDA